MDREFVLMLAFAFFMIPMTYLLANSLLKRWLDHREKMFELMANQTAEKAAQYATKVERLEQRMRVMERIATDRGLDLAMQIEDLSDDRVKGVN
ncbi:hypothetical protein [Qipengyuania sphaerica]|uniref:hypothetical protein n=1 Tax=Qipengyuania sphaerica TaxID=2867243 RepID=UPI001FFC7298|nr:hypothetical protein [Qipengyuania sphaerica]